MYINKPRAYCFTVPDLRSVNRQISQSVRRQALPSRLLTVAFDVMRPLSFVFGKSIFKT